jgi:hypothetical protein
MSGCQCGKSPCECYLIRQEEKYVDKYHDNFDQEMASVVDQLEKLFPAPAPSESDRTNDNDDPKTPSGA